MNNVIVLAQTFLVVWGINTLIDEAIPKKDYIGAVVIFFMCVWSFLLALKFMNRISEKAYKKENIFR